MSANLTLNDLHVTLGASLAADGIPLHYGDQAKEYEAALNAAVLLERSHEGRLVLYGADRFTLMQRMSTNELAKLGEGQGQPTLFVNANGRIIDRATIYKRGDTAFVLSEPGRGTALYNYLARNIFFNDDARIEDHTAQTRQFNLHGRLADAVIREIDADLANLPELHGREIEINGEKVFIARNKPLSGSHWVISTPTESAPMVWSAILEAGKPHGLIPAGSLTYNVLRIRAGRPGVMRELNADYIPLELGLWDEVSFTKGCYTGQEIIARMESRNRLAKTIVSLKLAEWVEAPAPIFLDGREVGRLTSSVKSPTGEFFAIGVIKVAASEAGTLLKVSEKQIDAEVGERLGVQPASLQEDN